MELNIRPAEYRDLDDMVKIHCESWAYAYRDIMEEDFIRRKNRSRREKWQGILSAENRKHHIILLGDTAAGMISIDTPREAASPDTCEIFGLYILPEYTGMGIGTAAVSFAAEQIRRMGCRQISLWVLEPNTPARRFYEKLGFRPDGTEKLSYYDRPINLIRYIREIRS